MILCGTLWYICDYTFPLSPTPLFSPLSRCMVTAWWRRRAAAGFLSPVMHNCTRAAATLKATRMWCWGLTKRHHWKPLNSPIGHLQTQITNLKHVGPNLAQRGADRIHVGPTWGQRSLLLGERCHTDMSDYPDAKAIYNVSKEPIFIFTKQFCSGNDKPPSHDSEGDIPQWPCFLFH